MNYNVTDNRELIGDYFLEQDTTGRIHIYKKQGGNLEYIDHIDCIGVVPNNVFLKICKDYVGV